MSSIDFNKLIVAQSDEIKVKPQLKELPFGRPNKSSFIWVRSGQEFDSPVMHLYTPQDAGMDAHPYLVMKDVADLLEETGSLQTGKFYFYKMFGSGTLKLDFINMSLNKYGKMNKFNASRKDIYENEATIQWVRIRANSDAGYFSFAIPEDKLDEPKWSEKPANILEAIELAFKDYVIDSKDHPEIKKIRGKL